MFGRKEGDPLNGVWTKAWAFESTLPSSCLKSPDLKCGQIETKLPRKLRKFLGVRHNGPLLVRMSVMALDGEVESLASILVEAEGSSAGFFVRSRRTIGEDGELKIVKKLRVEREPGRGIGEIEPFADRHKIYVDALREVMGLWGRKFKEVSVGSFCRTCATQIDRLPRSVI